MSLIQTLIRYTMIFFAGWLIKDGYIDQGMVEPLVGIGLTASALLWFLFGKFFPEQKRAIQNVFETENI